MEDGFADCSAVQPLTKTFCYKGPCCVRHGLLFPAREGRIGLFSISCLTGDLKALQVLLAASRSSGGTAALMAAADATATARHKHIVFLKDTLACRELIRWPDNWTWLLLPMETPSTQATSSHGAFCPSPLHKVVEKDKKNQTSSQQETKLCF